MIHPGPYPLDREKGIESQTLLVNVYLGDNASNTTVQNECDKDRWSEQVGGHRACV